MPIDSTTQKTVLIIDDDQDIRESIKTGLEESALGAKIVTAHNAIVGLDLARAELPDVIVLDLSMPLGTGFEFMDQLRQEPSLASVKVLMLTANASSNNEWESIDRDIDDFMAKPFDLLELEARIANLLTKPFGTSRRL